MWPALWGAFFAAAEVFRAVAGHGAVEPVVWTGGGFILFFVLWICRVRPLRAYILAHELTHAAAGILCGARVGRLKVRASGGSVQLSKSNTFITLAPYLVPFYAVVLALAAVAVRLAVGGLPCVPAWLAAAGFLWAFHCCFTAGALRVRQPDIQECGRVFSWSLIALANVLFLAFSLAAAAQLPLSLPAGAVLEETRSAYAAVFEAARAAAGAVRRAACG